MPDTGAPWNIPYVASTDLVSDWPADSLALANAIDAGLDIAGASGGLIAVKHVLKTDAFTSGSLSAGGNTQITGTSITHDVADAANKVILIAHIGAAQSSDYRGQAGFAFHDGTNLLGRGDAASSRTRVVAGGWTSSNATFQRIVNTLAGTIVHTPGTGSKTYSLYVMNVTNGSATMYVNRPGGGTDANNPSASTSLTLLEVSV